MITPEKIDSIKNQYPHLSEQQITDMLMKSKEENLKSLYPNLTESQITEFLKDKPGSDDRVPAVKKSAKKKAAKKPVSEAEKIKRAASAAKGKATKAAKLAAKSHLDTIDQAAAAD